MLPLCICLVHPAHNLLSVSFTLSLFTQSSSRPGHLRALLFYTPQMFPHVYDATEAYQTKSEMKRLSLRDLVVGDIVLVEATVTRHSVRRGRAREWTCWDVDFRLDAISK